MTTKIKKLQREIAAYNRKSLKYDVYCDRVNFYTGFTSGCFLDTFFRNRGIIFDADRAGHSINLADAERIGIPTEYQTYEIPADARKKPVVISAVKASKIK